MEIRSFFPFLKLEKKRSMIPASCSERGKSKKMTKSAFCKTLSKSSKEFPSKIHSSF